MSSPLTRKQWLVVILVNVVVSAITTLMIVRVLTNQPIQTAAGAAPETNVPVASPTLPATPVEAPATSAEISVDVSPTTTPDEDSVAAIPTSTPTPENDSESTSTAPDTVASVDANVRISAVLYPGQRQREVVVIVNEGSEVEMKDWTLSSSRGITYTFGNVTLFRDSFINLHTTTGADVPTDLFWNRTEPAWQSGDVLTLSIQGKEIATYKVK
ncbi:MAG: lamin tail domain-containing protein [Chloroflexi bacterium]|nr:lamin tail domain-containing protein [Chloroflexota bacterium]